MKLIKNRNIILMIMSFLLCMTAVGCSASNGGDRVSTDGNNTDDTTPSSSDTEAPVTTEPKETSAPENSEPLPEGEPPMFTRKDFSGKKAAAYGDSIVYGAYRAPGDPGAVSRVSARWCDLLLPLLDFKSVANCGISGISISSTSKVNADSALAKQYAKVLPKDVEVIFIAAGTNDFGTEVPLGTAADREDVSFYGALDVLCEGLKTEYSDALVIFIAPIARINEGSNVLGHSLQDFRNAITEVAGERHGFTILDGSSFGFLPEDEAYREEYMLDGLHPNDKGHMVYAKKVVECLIGSK